VFSTVGVLNAHAVESLAILHHQLTIRELIILGAFTLGVRDSRVESPNTMFSHLGLEPIYHEEDFMLRLTFFLTLSYHPFNIGCHLGCHLHFYLTLT
jgi:hypothetical protein